jgi:hypothetical protein
LASLLPVSAKQLTEPVQLNKVDITKEKLLHAPLAVCHLMAIHVYQESGMACNLYEAGVAGFVVVERVLMDTDMLHLLSHLLSPYHNPVIHCSLGTLHGRNKGTINDSQSCQQHV